MIRALIDNTDWPAAMRGLAGIALLIAALFVITLLIERVVNRAEKHED